MPLNSSLSGPSSIPLPELEKSSDFFSIDLRNRFSDLEAARVADWAHQQVDSRTNDRYGYPSSYGKKQFDTDDVMAEVKGYYNGKRYTLSCLIESMAEVENSFEYLDEEEQDHANAELYVHKELYRKMVKAMGSEIRVMLDKYLRDEDVYRWAITNQSAYGAFNNGGTLKQKYSEPISFKDFKF